MRGLLRVHLQNAGFNVILAPDALVAGRTILERSHGIDVLLINAELPFMSGIDFVSTLIADRSLRFIPTIVIAASETAARRADPLGVPSLVPPFSADELVDMIRTTIGCPVKRTAAEVASPSMQQRLDELTIPIPQAASKRLRIVVCDDEPDTVTSLVAILSHEGHSVFGSRYPSDLLPEVRRSRPDAMILDIDMPGISGFTIAREVRGLFGELSPVLIAVSGKWFSQTDKMLAEIAGFDYFLQKPCHPDALITILHGRARAPAIGSALGCGTSLTCQS